MREYDTIGRHRGLALTSNDEVEVEVGKDERSVKARAYVAVVPGEEEALTSYALARELRIAVDLAREDGSSHSLGEAASVNKPIGP